MEKTNAQILEELSAITFQLVIKEPFYGHFFSGLLKRVGSQITETMAVSYENGLVILHINPIFWDNYLTTADFKTGVVKHEILHIVFNHILRYHDFSRKDLYNIAADLVVNQYVAETQLPEGAVLLSLFPELKLEAHQHVEYYYNQLSALYQQCTSGDNKDPNEENMENSRSWQNLKDLLDESNQNQLRHKLWQMASQLSNAERTLLSELLKQTLQNTLKRVKNKDIGNLPAGLQDYLKEFEKSLAPVVNWKRILRLFANSSSRTRIKNTLKRPSKRYNTTPGIKVKKRQKILVAIDTSGSISQQDLQEFFNEIYHIWKHGSEILVVECDTEIQAQYKYEGKTPQQVSGRGGTDFEAPLRFANEEYSPDAVIYFTDGYGNNPEVRCNCPILWLISPDGTEISYVNEFQGRKIKMIR
ncbi:MAG: hypothetical protein EAZ55_12250 [Cytophagales bacterium]|nr:MAG: hypothetical protein EAZ55_12250 [Cytophagales bacterium]